MIVTRVPSCSRDETARLMLWLRRCSSVSQSSVVVPASTDPSREIAPASKRIASARLVLPAPPWEMSATFLIRSGVVGFIGAPCCGRVPRMSPRPMESASGGRWREPGTVHYRRQRPPLSVDARRPELDVWPMHGAQTRVWCRRHHVPTSRMPDVPAAAHYRTECGADGP